MPCFCEPFSKQVINCWRVQAVVVPFIMTYGQLGSQLHFFLTCGLFGHPDQTGGICWGGIWMSDFDEQKTKWGGFLLLIWPSPLFPHLPPNFLDRRNVTSCLVSYVVNVKPLDKSGRGKLQLDIENSKRQKLVASKIIQNFSNSECYFCHVRHALLLGYSEWKLELERKEKQWTLSHQTLSIERLNG